MEMAKTLTVMPGTIPGVGMLFVTIKWDGLRLSITGVAGPKANGDARGSCGQRSDELDEVTQWTDGWTPEMGAKFKALWNRWHLNDMRAGSRVQEDWLRANPVNAVCPKSHYEAASEALAAVGLNPDPDGYKYGHAWKFEEVPAEVVERLFSFPVSRHSLPGAWAR